MDYKKTVFILKSVKLELLVDILINAEFNKSWSFTSGTYKYSNRVIYGDHEV